MRTFKNLFPQIVSFENLLLAAQRAAKGKRESVPVLRFFANLEENLLTIQQELISGEYSPGTYTTFRIYEPKPRIISAAPFRDRVVHHALMNIIQPVFENGWVFDSYANRIGKGTHRAIRRYQQFLRRFRYVLKCDIQKYFPSIDHAILKSLCRKRIADVKTLWLIDRIIDGSNQQELVLNYFPGDDLFSPVCRRKGLPIGNLTSQFFANVYLNPLDHFVKDVLGCPAYLRYVDDFALFADSKAKLHKLYAEIADFLSGLRLSLHPRRCFVLPARVGWRFLGQRVFRTHRLLDSRNVVRFRRRLRVWAKHPPRNREQRIQSWLGHAMQADTYCLMRSLSFVPGLPGCFSA